MFSEQASQIAIKFDYTEFGKRSLSPITQYRIILEPIHFQQPYLLIHVYDFHQRKYRKWYSHLTDEEYIAEIIYPNSGMYLRN